MNTEEEEVEPGRVVAIKDNIIIPDVLPSWVNEMNTAFALVRLGDTIRIMIISPEDDIGLLNATDFKLTCQNLPPVSWAPPGKESRIGARAPAWLSHPRRRQYLGGIGLFPLGEETDGCFNLWRGFSVEPKHGEWDLYDKHLFEVIAASDVSSHTYMLDWIAARLQNPFGPAGSAITLIGPQGVGKGTAVQPLITLFGGQGLHLTRSDLLAGQFNAHMAHKMFIFADEAAFAGDPRTTDYLKGLITEKTMMIHPKGVTPYKADNNTGIIFATNHAHGIDIEISDRRNAVFKIADHKRRNFDWFSAIHRQLNDEDGLAAFLYDMLERDVSNFNPEAIPNTDERIEQKRLSMNPFYQWIVEQVENGSFTDVKKDDAVITDEDSDHLWGTGPIAVSREAMRIAYWNAQAKHVRTLSQEEVGRAMVTLFGKGVKEDSSGSEKAKFGGKWTRAYFLPRLSDAREMLSSRLEITLKTN
jgi:hypothetical protein